MDNTPLQIVQTPQAPSTTEATNARMLTDVVGKIMTGQASGNSDIVTVLNQIATAIGNLPIGSGIAQNIQSADYTLVLSDAQKQIYHPVADTNNRTWTIPANASVAFPIGTVVTFVNRVNTITLAITSDTLVLMGTGSTGSKTLAANGIATALKTTSTEWVISGVGLS